MKFRYPLPDSLISEVAGMQEFANGGAQVSVRLKDGRVFHELLVSNSTALAAMRNFKDMPFAVDDIEIVFQTEDDKNPRLRGGWDFWDDWKN